MKGLTHFVSGLAAATFFPQAVNLAYNDTSFILVLGGIFGILPDTLDFKYARFVEKYHYHIDPDPKNPDPQKIAEEIAHAINEAHEANEIRSIAIHTMKLGADLWRQYSILFNREEGTVEVEIGPLVNTSQKPYPNTEVSGNTKGVAKLNCKLCPKIYADKTHVDIMTGPSFAFMPRKDGTVYADFLSWHRRWSHSLVLGVFLGICTWLLMMFFQVPHALVYGYVAATAFCVHVLEDQLGHMGSNLFWPLTKNRASGIGYMHSGDVWPNFLTVWLCMIFVFYNLNKFRPEPIFETSFMMYMLYCFVIPVAIMKLMEIILGYWENSLQKSPVK